jgi:hypothetical protein
MGVVRLREEAREEALRTLGEIVKDKLPDGDHRNFLIEIREGDGAPLLALRCRFGLSERCPVSQAGIALTQ